MAGAAIGVSHLVQSTRAGAIYGAGALLFVLLANLMKYPFYEYGHRYAAASGQTLIQAYYQQGKRYFIPFLILSLISAVGSFAVDAFVAGMLVKYLWLPQVSETLLAVGVLLFCWGLIALGRYHLFEQITKACVLVLAVATIVAVVAAGISALGPGSSSSTVLEVASTTNNSRAALFSWAALPFWVAFMGWMPGGLELSVWQSLWVQAASAERQAQESGESVTCAGTFPPPRPSAETALAEAAVDFNVGYGVTVVLACLFLILGSLTLPAQGLASEPAAFAGQLVGMYSGLIGAWAEPVIGLCAIAAIFSTTFTVVEAYPRTLETSLGELFPQLQTVSGPLRAGIALALIGLAAGLLSVFSAGFEPLIDTITIIAFIAAPFYAWLNMRSIDTLVESAQPAPWLARLAVVGLVYLSGFSLLFISLALV